MSYRVVITANAKANLRRYYARAAENAPVTALRWLDRFENALQMLSDKPAPLFTCPGGRFGGRGGPATPFR